MQIIVRNMIRFLKRSRISSTSLIFTFILAAIFLFNAMNGQFFLNAVNLLRLSDDLYETMLFIEVPEFSKLNHMDSNGSNLYSPYHEQINQDDFLEDEAAHMNEYAPEDYAEAQIEYSYETTAQGTDILTLLEAKPIAALTIAPSNPVGYTEFDGIYIKNDTKFDINIEASLKKELDFSLASVGPHVLIIHTHGSESYSETGKNYYMDSETNRSTDNSQNVILVGNRVCELLNKEGIQTIHIKELFDYPEYNGAYNRALEAISAQMKETPSIKMIIDIHRDAMVSQNGTKYKTVTRINDKNAAQLMFVCGTNEGGLPHSNWQSNLRMAIRLQKQINEKYPELMRPINLRSSRFNQHVTTGSMLVEFGTSGNTIEEALYSAELFSEELAEFLRSVR